MPDWRPIRLGGPISHDAARTGQRPGRDDRTRCRAFAVAAGSPANVQFGVLLEQKFHSWEQKFHSRVAFVNLQEPGIPRWRHDDLTSNVFGSDARVDTLACRVGIVASRSSGG